jgi:hypothetical protein
MWEIEDGDSRRELAAQPSVSGQSSPLLRFLDSKKLAGNSNLTILNPELCNMTSEEH